MTQEEINKLFPPSYGGVAQISDLRIVLSKINTKGEFNSFTFYYVDTISDRDNIDAENNDICKVRDDGTGNPQTYIYYNDSWVVLVENTGGSGTQLIKKTETFTISGTQSQNQKVTLEEIPNTNDHLFVFLNGLYLTMGVDDDFTLVGNELQFNDNLIETGDKLTVKYSY